MATKTPSLPSVFKTRQMFDIEQSNGGRDIRLILVETYNELKTVEAVADRFGVTSMTINNWFNALGIEIETVRVAKISPLAA